MEWKTSLGRAEAKARRKCDEWGFRHWFAWYPVKLFDEETYVWLDKVRIDTSIHWVNRADHRKVKKVLYTYHRIPKEREEEAPIA